jgi:hypothetical protein
LCMKKTGTYFLFLSQTILLILLGRSRVCRLSWARLPIG